MGRGIELQLNILKALFDLKSYTRSHRKHNYQPTQPNVEADALFFSLNRHSRPMSNAYSDSTASYPPSPITSPST